MISPRAIEVPSGVIQGFLLPVTRHLQSPLQVASKGVKNPRKNTLKNAQKTAQIDHKTDHKTDHKIDHTDQQRKARYDAACRGERPPEKVRIFLKNETQQEAQNETDTR
ncbi:hypothetical protein U5B40_004842 [Escherichia coli]|nr:hypothetical protein [Escherichia coli]